MAVLSSAKITVCFCIVEATSGVPVMGIEWRRCKYKERKKRKKKTVWLPRNSGKYYPRARDEFFRLCRFRLVGRVFVVVDVRIFNEHVRRSF